MTNQFRTTGPKISANQTCEQLLREIKKSNLNFYISESPFAVTINLKKSFIKQKDGSVRDSKLISEHQLVDQIHRNIEVEELSKNLFETKKGLHETYNKIKMKSDEFEVQINEKKRELLIAENKILELDTKLKEITPNLEKQSEKLKILEDDKRNPSRNDLNANIVTINESEAEENRQLGHNASTSFDTVANSANSFSISSSKSVSSSNSKTLTSRGFVFSPTPQNKSNLMANCSHTPQCTIRQQYGDTHERCMAVEYERYGCESCIWLKCHGDLHGYPDINPWDYRQYKLSDTIMSRLVWQHLRAQRI